MPQRYRAIFESAVDFAIVAADREGLVTDWNPGAARVLGWSAEEMRGEPVDRFFTPEDRAAHRPAIEMSLALAEGRASDERWHLRKDGTRFFAVGEMTPLLDEAGEHPGFLKILTDRTVEREARAALSASEADLHRAPEAGGVGLFSLDVATNTMRVTPEFCRVFGLRERPVFPAAEVELLFVHDEDGIDTGHSTAESRREGPLRLDVEYRIRRPGTGKVHWIVRKAEIERDAAGAPIRVVGAVQDVTERVAASVAVREIDQCYHALFDRVESGFCIAEVAPDGTDGQRVDYRVIEANPAFYAQTGFPEAIPGHWLRESAPALEEHWHETYGAVARTGSPAPFEQGSEALGRWFDVFAFRLEAGEGDAPANGPRCAQPSCSTTSQVGGGPS